MRLWIVAVLLGWMAILAVLAYVPTPVIGPPMTSSDEKWLDFARTLVASLAGALAGAGAAFFANYKLQDRARLRTERAAGNSATANTQADVRRLFAGQGQYRHRSTAD